MQCLEGQEDVNALFDKFEDSLARLGAAVGQPSPDRLLLACRREHCNDRAGATRGPFERSWHKTVIQATSTSKQPESSYKWVSRSIVQPNCWKATFKDAKGHRQYAVFHTEEEAARCVDKAAMQHRLRQGCQYLSLVGELNVSLWEHIQSADAEAQTLGVLLLDCVLQEPSMSSKTKRKIMDCYRAFKDVRAANKLPAAQACAEGLLNGRTLADMCKRVNASNGLVGAYACDFAGDDIITGASEGSSGTSDLPQGVIGSANGKQNYAAATQPLPPRTSAQNSAPVATEAAGAGTTSLEEIAKLRNPHDESADLLPPEVAVALNGDAAQQEARLSEQHDEYTVLLSKGALYGAPGYYQPGSRELLFRAKAAQHARAEAPAAQDGEAAAAQDGEAPAAQDREAYPGSEHRGSPSRQSDSVRPDAGDESAFAPPQQEESVPAGRQPGVGPLKQPAVPPPSRSLLDSDPGIGTDPEPAGTSPRLQHTRCQSGDQDTRSYEPQQQQQQQPMAPPTASLLDDDDLLRMESAARGRNRRGGRYFASGDKQDGESMPAAAEDAMHEDSMDMQPPEFQDQQLPPPDDAISFDGDEQAPPQPANSGAPDISMHSAGLQYDKGVESQAARSKAGDMENVSEPPSTSTHDSEGQSPELQYHHAPTSGVESEAPSSAADEEEADSDAESSSADDSKGHSLGQQHTCQHGRGRGWGIGRGTLEDPVLLSSDSESDVEDEQVSKRCRGASEHVESPVKAEPAGSRGSAGQGRPLSADQAPFGAPDRPGSLRRPAQPTVHSAPVFRPSHLWGSIHRFAPQSAPARWATGPAMHSSGPGVQRASRAVPPMQTGYSPSWRPGPQRTSRPPASPFAAAAPVYSPYKPAQHQQPQQAAKQPQAWSWAQPPHPTAPKQSDVVDYVDLDTSSSSSGGGARQQQGDQEQARQDQGDAKSVERQAPAAADGAPAAAAIAADDRSMSEQNAHEQQRRPTQTTAQANGPALREAAQGAVAAPVNGEAAAENRDAQPGCVLERDREALAEIEAREWEQRRVEIERQAEEARREKKRKRAEADIAQRSQARLEDHRRLLAAQESQQGERERLRTEVRALLEQRIARAWSAETTLRALNIPLEYNPATGAPNITKAIRRALLFYHPDRHQNAPLRTQVEAEEIFKIISHVNK